jgi:hypothetical protein
MKKKTKGQSQSRNITATQSRNRNTTAVSKKRIFLLPMALTELTTPKMMTKNQLVEKALRSIKKIQKKRKKKEFKMRMFFFIHFFF